jgi:hypothetical protein
MTTCAPIRPFRCWQYRKDSTEPVPEWVQHHGRNVITRPDGAWVVAIIDSANFWSNKFTCVWYTAAEFQERFKLSSESARVEEGK